MVGGGNQQQEPARLDKENHASKPLNTLIIDGTVRVRTVSVPLMGGMITKYGKQTSLKRETFRKILGSRL